jgi:hypothetical protein
VGSGGGTWDASRAVDEPAESHRAGGASGVGPRPPPGDIGPYADRKVGHYTQMQAGTPPRPTRVGATSLVEFEAGRVPPLMPPTGLLAGPTAPVQRSTASTAPMGSHLDWSSGGPLPEAQVHAHAAEGVSGPGSPVPHRAALERSLGPAAAPLLDRISVHQDDRAKAASAAIGARAYATGDHIALPPSPSEHLVAHEVAHIVQQAEGVHLSGGVGQEGDSSEREADAFADAVVAGQPASGDLGAHSATAGHRQVQRREEHGNAGWVNAAAYLSTNAAALHVSVAQYLAGVPWPLPHARLSWRDVDAFTHGVARQLHGAWGDLSTTAMLHALERQVHPANPLRMVDEMRAVVGPPGPAGENPFVGGPVGPPTWHASIGVAIGQLVQAALVDSLHRLAPRWVECADHAPDAKDLLHAPMSIVRFGQLVTSHPVDVVVAHAITDLAVLDYRPPTVDPTPHAPAAEPAGAPTRLRPVRYEWQGARSPHLWNWVRVLEPTDVTPEEVASALFKNEDGDGESFQAYALIGARPLFGVPASWAKRIPAAAKHSPDEGNFLEKARAEAAGPAPGGVLAVADSVAAPEIAIAQRGSTSEVRAEQSPAIQRAVALLGESRSDLVFLARLFARWGLESGTAIALKFLETRNAELVTATEATVTAWLPVLDGQRGHLAQIMSLVHALDAAAGTLGAEVTRTNGGGPLREIMDVLAQATGASAFNETCPALIAKAAKLQQALPLHGLRSSTRAAGAAIDEVRDSTNADGDAQELTREFAGVDATAQHLAATMIAGGAVDGDELDDAMLHADEIALRARVHSAVEQLDVLRAQSSIEGVWEELAAMPSADLHSMRAALPVLIVKVAQVADDLRMESTAQSVATDATGAERRAAMRRYRRDAVTRAQATFAQIQADQSIGDFLRNGAQLVRSQQMRTACVKVGVMLGISLAGGAIAGAAGRAFGAVVGGGTELTALARAAQFTLEVGVDAGVNTAGQAAVASLDRRPPPDTKAPSGVDAFLENAIIIAGSRGILAGIKSQAEALEDLERTATAAQNSAKSVVPQVGRATALAMEGAAITGHTLMGAGLSYAAHKLVASKLQAAEAEANGSLDEWFLQGASIAVARHLAPLFARARARLERLAAPRELLEANAALARQARALADAGDRVSGEATLELLARTHEHLVAEEEAALTIKDDPARRAAAGISTTDAAAIAADVHAEVRAAHDPAQVTVPMHLVGLEEAVPGALWRGTHAQATEAINAARRMGLDVEASYDTEAHRWKVRAGSQELNILEHLEANGASHTKDPAPPALAGEFAEAAGTSEAASRATLAEQQLFLAGSDAEIAAYAVNVRPKPDTLDVFVHGTVDDFIVVGPDGAELHVDHRRLALYIEKSGKKFSRVRLISCRTGAHPKGAAQHLANKLHVDVVEAPTDKVHIASDGSMTIGPRPGRDSGRWVDHSPRPAERRFTKAKEPPAERAIDRLHRQRQEAQQSADEPIETRAVEAETAIGTETETSERSDDQGQLTRKTLGDSTSEHRESSSDVAAGDKASASAPNAAKGRTALAEHIPPPGPEFVEWFDSLTPTELDQLLRDRGTEHQISAREVIERSVRHPGGLHEWLMVKHLRQVKKWGISLKTVLDARTRTEATVGRAFRHGGAGSTTMHIALSDMIAESTTYEGFLERLNAWADRELFPVHGPHGEPPHGRYYLPEDLQIPIEGGGRER